MAPRTHFSESGEMFTACSRMLSVRFLIPVTMPLMISPELFTRSVIWSIAKFRKKTSRPIPTATVTSTSTTLAAVRLIFSFFSRKRIGCCSMAAIGIARMKGLSLSQISGSSK